MNGKRFKQILCTMLVVVLAGLCVSQPAAAATETVKQETGAAPKAGGVSVGGKEEVVYANLANDGAVDQIYVVNQFDVHTGGSLTDYGSYSTLTNLTTTEQVSKNGDAVSAPVNPGMFYYQGTLASADLPWIFDIGYYLNGTKLDLRDVPGASGKLEIRISTRRNTAVDEVFFENYMLQISLTLDSSKCSNISSPGATVANAGTNKVIAHTVMPGKEADITVSADVMNFTMAGLEIAGMPFSMPIEIPDTDEMVGEMATLADAVDALNDGVGDLADGVDELNAGVGKLVTGSAEFASGLSTLSGSGSQLVAGSAQINSSLATVSASLSGSGGGDMGLGDIAQLPGGLRQMAQGLGQVSTGLVNLKSGYAGMYSALNASIMAIPAVPDGDMAVLEGIMAGYADGSAEKNAWNSMKASYGAGQALMGAYTYVDPSTGLSIQMGLGAVATSLDAMAASLDTMVTSLNDMAAGIETALSSSDTMAELQQLAEGMATLAAQYNTFHAGLVEYAGGVTEVSAGYGELHNGLASLNSGTGELAAGSRKLHKGTGELNNAVGDLPDTIQLEIDSLLADYDTEDFQPVSFTSSRNTNVDAVQFVLMTEGISLPETADAQEEEPPKETLWDRFIQLFT